VALELRGELVAIYDSLGALHHQIGKYYSYVSMMGDSAMPEFLKKMKSVLDPNHHMNPGSLELE